MKLGVDVGGTFTDLILINSIDGSSISHKVPSTSEDPAKGVINGIQEICRLASIEPRQIEEFYHGTTIATNIILQHNGANVGMITTEGFKDILHIGRHKRPYNFSLYQDLPWQKYPLIKRENRLTIKERITAEGEVLIDLNEEEVREKVRELKRKKVDAIAICLLFSFKNSIHEEKVKEIVQQEYPEVFLSISNEVLPQYREYERFSTVALNAFIGPQTSNYIKRLQNNFFELGLETNIHLMQSNGGIATSETAVEKPVNLLLSGPVAGLIGGIKAANNSGFNNVITLDIGGTSADIGVALDGKKRMRHLLDTKIGQYNAMIPMVDIDTIGAGGGSVAYVDDGGIFRVGPQSAGAEPGPACYSRGGKLPTSTDANVLLGRIRPEGKLAGSMTVNSDLSKLAFQEHISNKLDIDEIEAAAGALKIMTHNMINAIEENSVRKGYDPREFTLVAAGGAGPLFACDIAEELSIPNVVVPPYPGITAAVGLLSTDISYEQVSTVWCSVANSQIDYLKNKFRELEEKAYASLKQDGIEDENIILKRVCDCRYAGQGYELRVDAPEGKIDQVWVEKLISAFHEVHENEYASKFLDQEVMAINIRVIGVGIIKTEENMAPSPNNSHFSQSLITNKPVYFWVNDELKEIETNFYDREIPYGTELSGPAIIQQKDSTTIIPPLCSASFDYKGNIVIDMAEKIKSKLVKATEKIQL